MLTTDIAIPGGLRTARVSHAGGREGRSTHLILDRPLRVQRLTRQADDALCRPAARFAHLTYYRQQVVPVADVCPQCLVMAVKLRLLSAGAVAHAEQAFAALRETPVGVASSRPPAMMSPWLHLPVWSDIPTSDQEEQGGGVRKFTRAMLVARSLGQQPEPMRASMDAAWFNTRLAAVPAGSLHRSPILLRLPQPCEQMERITILPAADGRDALRAIPLARLGADLVVSVSAFDVATKCHRPVGFIGGIERYREVLTTWHRYPLTERARHDRWEWRCATVQALVTAGATDRQVAAWMFESLTYIRDLQTTAATLPSNS